MNDVQRPAAPEVTIAVFKNELEHLKNGQKTLERDISERLSEISRKMDGFLELHKSIVLQEDRQKNMTQDLVSLKEIVSEQVKRISENERLANEILNSIGEKVKTQNSSIESTGKTLATHTDWISRVKGGLRVLAWTMGLIQAGVGGYVIWSVNSITTLKENQVRIETTVNNLERAIKPNTLPYPYKLDDPKK